MGENGNSTIAGGNCYNFAEPSKITSWRIKLLYDCPLQNNASALLPKIVQMVLPLKFHDLIPTLVESVAFYQG